MLDGRRACPAAAVGVRGVDPVAARRSCRLSGSRSARRGRAGTRAARSSSSPGRRGSASRVRARASDLVAGPLVVPDDERDRRLARQRDVELLLARSYVGDVRPHGRDGLVEAEVRAAARPPSPTASERRAASRAGSSQDTSRSAGRRLTVTDDRSRRPGGNTAWPFPFEPGAAPEPLFSVVVHRSSPSTRAAAAVTALRRYAPRHALPPRSWAIAAARTVAELAGAPTGAISRCRR